MPGHHIPKGSNLLINLWSVLRDPEIWSPDPNKFRPERHLDENGRFSPNGKVVTLGGGPRVCGGMEIVRPIVLSYLVNFVGNFEFEFGEGDLNSEGESILLYTPPNFSVVLKPRE